MTRATPHVVRLDIHVCVHIDVYTTRKLVIMMGVKKHDACHAAPYTYTQHAAPYTYTQQLYTHTRSLHRHKKTRKVVIGVRVGGSV